MNNLYNGWTNHETWLTNLWLSELFINLDLDLEQLTAYIEDYIYEDNPLKDNSGLYVDLLNSSLREINYREIAENILNET